MLKYEVIVNPEFDRLVGRLRRYPNLVDPPLLAAMRDSTAHVEGGARREAPVGVNGRLRRSIASTVRRTPTEILGRVGPTLRSEIYPLVMEVGRKPGKAPPPGALDRWVRIRLRVPEKMVKSVAFLIGRRMKTKPIKGRFYMRKALQRSRRFINARFSKALDEILKILAGKRGAR